MENIKEYILDDAVLDNKAEVDEKPKTKSATIYETVFVSGPDFAVRRKTAKTSTVMVVILSKGQSYIKYESRGGSMEEIDFKNLTAFLSDLPNGVFEIKSETGDVPFWISTLEKNADFKNTFIEEIENDMFREFAKKNLCTHLDNGGFRSGRNIVLTLKDIEWIAKISEPYVDRTYVKQAVSALLFFKYHLYFERTYKDINARKFHSVLESLMETDRLGEMGLANTDMNTSNFDFIVHFYGKDGLKQMVERFFETAVTDFPRIANLKKIFELEDKKFSNRYVVHKNYESKSRKEYFEKPFRTFVFSDFLDYLFNEAVAQGFEDDISGFCYSWADYLGMQESYYKEIRERYPKALMTQEKILSRKVAVLEKSKDNEGFKARVKDFLPYEYKGEKYCLVAPKEAKDVIDEGLALSHCVAAYVSSIIAGQTNIFFLRKTSAPDESLVTIQVDNDGTLRQARGRFNRNPTPDQIAFIEKWQDKFFRKKIA